MSKDNMPIEAYPSEYIDFLKRASLERIEVKLPSYADCIKVRGRINSLRSMMKKVNHPDYQNVARASISIPAERDRPKLPFERQGYDKRVTAANGWSIVGAPRDHVLLGAFHEAGIEPSIPPPDILDDFPLDDPDMTQLFKDL